MYRSCYMRFMTFYIIKWQNIIYEMSKLYQVADLMITVGHQTFFGQIASHLIIGHFSVQSTQHLALMSDYSILFTSSRLHCSGCHCVNYGFGGWHRVGLAPTNYTDHNDSAAGSALCLELHQCLIGTMILHNIHVPDTALIQFANIGMK